MAFAFGLLVNGSIKLENKYIIGTRTPFVRADYIYKIR